MISHRPHTGHMIALSNMPETSTVEISDGRKKTSFEKSPPMAPYLLALVVGEFDFLEKSTAAGVKVCQRNEGREGCAPAHLLIT